MSASTDTGTYLHNRRHRPIKAEVILTIALCAHVDPLGLFEDFIVVALLLEADLFPAQLAVPRLELLLGLEVVGLVRMEWFAVVLLQRAWTHPEWRRSA